LPDRRGSTSLETAVGYFSNARLIIFGEIQIYPNPMKIGCIAISFSWGDQ
jgi:hypothetical protein